MAKGKKQIETVLYLGLDTGFFQNIMQRFRNTYASVEWDFPKIPIKEQGGCEALYLEVINTFPKIAYIDFCQNVEKAVEIAEMMSRDPYFEDIPLVGLVDNKEDTVPLLSTGIDFIFVKGGEFHDIIYAPMNIAFPKMVVKPNFAKGKVAKEVNLIDDFRVSFITPTYIHVEGNFFLDEDKEVFFKTDIPKKNVPSQTFLIKNRSSCNLYYDFNYSYDLDFKFVDPPHDDIESEIDADAIEDEKARIQALKEAKNNQRQRIAEFEEDLKRSQKKHKE